MYTIYTLSHPTTREVFYVGHTSKSLSERLSIHIYDSKRRPTTRFHKYLSALPGRPTIEPIEVVASNPLQIEDFWYEQLRHWGFDLKNTNRPKRETHKSSIVPVSADTIKFLSQHARIVRVYLKNNHIAAPQNVDRILLRKKCNKKTLNRIERAISEMPLSEMSMIKYRHKMPVESLSDDEIKLIKRFPLKDAAIKIGIDFKTLRNGLKGRELSRRRIDIVRSYLKTISK